METIFEKIDSKILIIVGVLVIAIVGLVTFIVLDSTIDKKTNNQATENEKDDDVIDNEGEKEDEVDKEDYSTEASELYKLIEDFHEIGLIKNMNSYNMKLLYASDMPTELKMSMAFNALNLQTEGNFTITKEDLKSGYERIFGGATYKDGTFANKCTYCDCPEEIKYSNGNYVFDFDACGCGSGVDEKLIYDGFDMEGKYIKVNVRVAYIYSDPNSKDIIYGDSALTKTIAYSNSADDYKKYTDKLDLQTYTFIKDTTGYYVLYAIEL